MELFRFSQTSTKKFTMSWIEIPDETLVRSLDLSLLKVDEAYLNISTDTPFQLYKLSDECYRCPFSFFKKIEQSQVLTVSTKYNLIWRVYDGDRSVNLKETISDNDTDSMLCEIRPKHFGEFGVYDLIYQNGSCTLNTFKNPVNTYLPLLVIVIALLILALLYTFVSFSCKRFSKSNISIDEINNKNKGVNKKRVKAVDTFRGISIILMIFVNYGAGSYWFLEHATWNGLLIADLVFPWFMWIMGVCIPISVRAQLKRNVPRTSILLGALRRSIILFLLGLSLNTLGVGANLTTIRLFGVLQRFAIVYFVVALLAIIFTFRVHYENSMKKGAFSDILNLAPQWLVVLAILAGHCYLTFFFPVPGCPIGYLGPGGIQHDNLYQNCTGGAAGYIDKFLLGTNHLYQHPTASEIYGTGPFDPEGILGCLTSIFQVFLGVQAGSILLTYEGWIGRIKRLLIWGTVFGLLGLILCQARQENGWVPLNKNIWSLSFVCVTSCLAFYLLSLLYFVIDIKKLWTGAPFIYPGMNATILYVGHSICYEMFPWHWSYGNMNTHFILTIEAIWGTALWVITAYWLFREKFFLSL